MVKFLLNVYTVGFLACRSPSEERQRHLQALQCIKYLPHLTRPQPIVFMVPGERIVPVDMNVDKGVEFMLSAGFMGKGETKLKMSLGGILPTRLFGVSAYSRSRAGRSAGRSLPWHGRGLGFKSRPVHFQAFYGI